MAKMSIAAFVRTARVLPVEMSILMRGGTGIGKSQLARQLAKDWGFNPKDVSDGGDFVDRRLAQMSEGDVIGLPSTDGNVTRFNPPDWYKDTCVNPRVLLLDELNRATNEVMQAAFQIVLDRCLNGWKLHPETRVLSAVNMGAEFVVNEMDPALLRRFWTVDLEPTKLDWMKWAENRGIWDVIRNFLDLNYDKCMHPSEKGNMDDVQPTPASWERLHIALEAANIIDKPDDPVFKPMCLGFIGTETTTTFVEYAQTVSTQLTADMIVEKYKPNSSLRKRVRKQLSNERWASTMDQLGLWCRDCEDVPTDDQIKCIVTFVSDAPVEIRAALPAKLSEPKKDKDGNITNKKYMQVVKKVWEAILPIVAETYDLDVSKKQKSTSKK